MILKNVPTVADYWCLLGHLEFEHIDPDGSCIQKHTFGANILVYNFQKLGSGYVA